MSQHRASAVGAGREGSGAGGDTAGPLAALSSPRTAALAGIAVLTGASVATLYPIASAVGSSQWLLGGVALAVGAAVLLRSVSERTVVLAAGVAAVATAAWYAHSAAPAVGPGAVLRAVGDTLALASGIPITQVAAVDVWVAAVTPVPVFLSAHLAIRGRYVLASVAGGWLLVFLALTGDAGGLETLVGALGAAAAVGFGELDRRGGSLGRGDLVVATLALMAVGALAVPVVPSGEASPMDYAGGLGIDEPAGGTGASVPLDDQLLSGNSAVPGGPVSLSTDVRFVVAADERRRWRVSALDRYTGDGWARTGGDGAYRGTLPGPPGPSRTVMQRYDLRASGSAIPAAAYPVELDGLEDAARVTGTGTLEATRRLTQRDTYTVRSEIPTPTTDQLREAGTDYPAGLADRYTQLPDDFPGRVGTLTDEVTAEADDPYETAVAVQAYLQDVKAYSRDVAAPDGDVAYAFLFEMEAGYCTYFASTMAAMLRTQGIPARVAVGYNSGQYAGEDTWVVRGTDAHAWVEVYFPDVGWVEFDPTPAAEWRDARVDRIEEARAEGVDDVDVPESVGRDVSYEPPETGGDDGGEGPGPGDGPGDEPGDGPDEPVPGGQQSPLYSGLGQPVLENETTKPYVDPDASLAGPDGEGRSGGPVGSVVSPGGEPLGTAELPVLGLLLLVGAAAGARRTGAGQRVRRSAALLWQRRHSPERDVERAVDRLDLLLARRHRPRRPGETRREYVAALEPGVDDRVHRALALAERARYAGELDGETADQLVTLVDELVADLLGPAGVISR